MGVVATSGLTAMADLENKIFTRPRKALLTNVNAYLNEQYIKVGDLGKKTLEECEAQLCDDYIQGRKLITGFVKLNTDWLAETQKRERREGGVKVNKDPSFTLEAEGTGKELKRFVTFRDYPDVRVQFAIDLTKEFLCDRINDTKHYVKMLSEEKNAKKDESETINV